MKAVKPATYDEGPQAWERFIATMKQVLAVPHSTIQKRVEEHRKAAAKNPNRRGPKPKEGGASRAPAV